MYCKIKHIECDKAGSLTYKGEPMLNETEGMHTITVCYKKGGYIKCDK